ncbi:hypothetical protein L6164_012625 [Bauhinia variegata]|uniref:Uncharacterized protein n=2 Tax=Bauhinia variegata TaxID=167791 RepID=A0ACB9PAL0_BAUVA|nr:hypothetical protein L6164_012625 [Bauhinia variegata]
MEVQPHFSDDPSSAWDLDCLLDFNLDDEFGVSLDCDQNSELPEPLELPPQPQVAPADEKIRKRDPRLTCSNFLAGRVPCACPELDEKLEEEGLPGKKRPRTMRASAGIARCQVPGCEADISELKGYHKRHRVCLRCANASTVMLDGEAKRYCQQCGKFHILSDFDEGKRSCRRKLERHNNRRRRKPTDSRTAVENETQSVLQTEAAKFDSEVGKDNSYLSDEMTEKGGPLEHEDGQVTTQCPVPATQNINSDSGVSFDASGVTQVNGGKDNFNFSHSPSFCNNKNAYASMCPTGRISFKLYDWNPAEFPRRLRHQIFQWLASMPVELEGYIRPGCTILTAFIAMPKFMWINLLEDPVDYVRDLVVPGKMLSGRGNILVHLNDMIFRVVKDGSSVVKVELKVKAPRLHYVHPTCFEAGKPMEFVACGSNLLQPKFRLLVSFSGKYLKSEYCVASPHNSSGDNISCAFEHQLYKISIPQTVPNLFGPAYIEVENESGLSNFIPVLIGDKEICLDIEALQQRLDASLLSKQLKSASAGSICNSCKASILRHTAYSDLLLDISWLLKDPTSENFHRAMTASQVQRFCYLLDFLIFNDSSIILRKILQNLTTLTENLESSNTISGVSNDDLLLLKKCMNHARGVLDLKHQNGGCLLMYSEMKQHTVAECSFQYNISSTVPISSQGIEARSDAKLGVLSSPYCNERIPLLKSEIIMNMDSSKQFPRKSGHRYLARGVFSSRPAIFTIAAVALCIGVCAALLHPGKVGEFAVTIRRCLFNR